MAHHFALVPYVYIEEDLIWPLLYPVDFKTFCIEFQTSFENDVRFPVSQKLIVEGYVIC